MGKETSPSETRQALLKEVNKIVVTRGMPRDEYNRKKSLLVAPGWTVEDLIEAGLASGELKWREDTVQFVSKGRNNGT